MLRDPGQMKPYYVKLLAGLPKLGIKIATVLHDRATTLAARQHAFRYSWDRTTPCFDVAGFLLEAGGEMILSMKQPTPATGMRMAAKYMIEISIITTYPS